MRKPRISVYFITLAVCVPFCHSAPVRKLPSLNAHINPYYFNAMTAYKNLEPKLSRKELRTITTIGILNGAKKAEKQIEQNLIENMKDLLFNTNMTDTNLVLPKIHKIENQLKRDHLAVEILSKSLDMAINSKDSKMFQLEMINIAKKHKISSTPDNDSNRNREKNIANSLSQLRRQILKQVDLMKNTLNYKIDLTLEYLVDHADFEGILDKANKKMLKKRQTEEEQPARITQVKSILSEDDFHNNMIEMPKAVNKDGPLANGDPSLVTDNGIETNNSNDAQNKTGVSGVSTLNSKNVANEKEGSSEFLNDDNQPTDGAGAGGGGGGLVGIITSLSGGEGGSDIGALIGALTGVISQIFGPGGLDIESLISSATALISGLLAGDRNFGSVLGIYVGTAFDGLSGGGGAINNGKFIGNFLGTVVASLSADPEEDDEPPKPLIFLKNLVTSFIEAKNRPLTDDESAERSDKNETDNKGGSDSAYFIKHIVSHVVGGVVSLILNTALGASGGASKASQSVLAGSSAWHMPEPPNIKI